MSGAEHSSASRRYRRKAHETYWIRYIVVDGFHAALHEIGFVPEACAAGVTQEFFPPFAMRGGASPSKKRLRIAPILAHACVHGKQGEEKVLVEQEAIRCGGDRAGDFGAETEERLETRQPIDAHAEVDDDEVGVLRKIDGLTIDLGGHK